MIDNVFINREISDTCGITALLGDYRARALFSKTFSLREAAIIKGNTYIYYHRRRIYNSNNMYIIICR